MLRISKLTDYATVILADLSADPEKLHTAAEVAARTRLAAPTVSKLLKSLQRAGLVCHQAVAHDELLAIVQIAQRLAHGNARAFGDLVVVGFVFG